jgi:large conductance mechanosensitive channel
VKRALTEFRDFLLRGNIVMLAVAFVIGLAFAAVVTAFVRDWVTPLIGAIFGGQGPFGSLSFTVHHSVFSYGDFVDALITFVAIAAAVFFFVVRPYDAVTARMKRGEEAPPEPTLDQQLLIEIRDLLANGRATTRV